MRLHRIVGVVALTGLGIVAAAPATAAPAAAGDTVELTLLATTDTHGHVFNWDYFANAEYTKDADILGLTRVGTVVDEVRAAKGPESVLVFDNGDAIQGTPLTYYYGMGDGAASVLDNAIEHPMAQAFNAIGYDAQVVGNHEYNYGLDMLSAYENDLEAPLLGANVIDAKTDAPYHKPYELIERTIDGKQVTVGVLGVVTPGIRIWDKANVEGILEFDDMVETAKKWVPEIEAQADVVVVLAHTGQGTVADADYVPADLNEDVANNIATQVPGIDVLVAGHSHQDKPETVLTNVAGEKVLITQPSYWARGVTETTLNLVEDASGNFDVNWADAAKPTVKPHYGKDTATKSQTVVTALQDEHQQTIDYVNTPVARSTEALPAETSRYEDTAIIDFINYVQADTVETALDGGPLADIPVISQASPFSRTAMFPEGEVTIRDIAGLYIYENTLRGVQITGAQLRDYLEFSARYFNQIAPGAAFDPATGTNAVTADRPTGIPDYNYDALSGVDYEINVSQPVGSRIQGLSYADGSAIGDDDQFVLAVNNYRQSGGGGFPAVADAPIVYDELQEIRQLLIDWAGARGTIDPADFFVQNWALSTAAVVAPEPTPVPTDPADPTDPATPAPGTGDEAGSGSGSGAGSGTAGSGSNSGSLANSGAENGALVAGAATLLLMLGAGSTVIARRRRQRA